MEAAYRLDPRVAKKKEEDRMERWAGLGKIGIVWENQSVAKGGQAGKARARSRRRKDDPRKSVLPYLLAAFA